MSYYFRMKEDNVSQRNKELRAIMRTIIMIQKFSWKWEEMSGEAEVISSFSLAIMHLWAGTEHSMGTADQ